MDESRRWLNAAEAVSAKIGPDFLNGLVEALRSSMEASLVFITEREPGSASRVRSRYAIEDGEPIEEFAYDLEGEPCMAVIDGRPTVIECDLAQLYPAEEGYEGYAGVPLRGADGAVVGHLAVLSVRPIAQSRVAMAILSVFGQRIEAEHERQRLERQRAELMADLDRLNQRLRRRYGAAREANEAQTRLLGVIAHDLQGPLDSILAQAARIESSARRASPALRDVRDAGAEVVSNAEHVAELIEATLTRVRTQHREHALERTRTDLANVVRMAAEANAPAATAKNVALRCEGDANLIAEVDEELMLEAIDGLISHAIQRSPAGGSVEIATSADGGRARIGVSDQGRGLAEMDLDRMFGRFGLLSARSTAEEAAAAGLFSVKEIAEAHGGAARGENRPQGMVFTIEVPQ